MLEAVVILGSAIFFFWAVVLVAISMAVEEQRIFWVQRIIALCFLVIGTSMVVLV